MELNAKNYNLFDGLCTIEQTRTSQAIYSYIIQVERIIDGVSQPKTYVIDCILDSFFNKMCFPAILGIDMMYKGCFITHDDTLEYSVRRDTSKFLLKLFDCLFNDWNTEGKDTINARSPVCIATYLAFQMQWFKLTNFKSNFKLDYWGLDIAFLGSINTTMANYIEHHKVFQTVFDNFNVIMTENQQSHTYELWFYEDCMNARSSKSVTISSAEATFTIIIMDIINKIKLNQMPENTDIDGTIQLIEMLKMMYNISHRTPLTNMKQFIETFYCNFSPMSASAWELFKVCCMERPGLKDEFLKYSSINWRFHIFQIKNRQEAKRLGVNPNGYCIGMYKVKPGIPVWELNYFLYRHKHILTPHEHGGNVICYNTIEEARNAFKRAMKVEKPKRGGIKYYANHYNCNTDPIDRFLIDELVVID